MAKASGARAWAALIAASQARLRARDDGQDAALTWLTARLAALALPGSEDHPAFRLAAQAFSRPV
jgi:hypothetical protein